MEWFTQIGLAHYLALSAVLFALGALGVMVRRNLLVVFMSVELMLNSVNLTLLGYARQWGDEKGHVLALIVMAVAAAEAALGLAITVAAFRHKKTVNADEFSEMRH